MDSFTIVGNVESTARKIPSVNKFIIRNINSTSSRHFIIIKLLQPYILRIICVAELYKPMTL